MSSEWFAIYNPVSGGGRGLRDRIGIERHLAAAGIPFAATVSQYPGHAIILAEEAVRRGYRKLLVVGGDGSVNEAVNGIFRQTAVPSSHVTLALLPCGSGNDWARTVGIPRRYEEGVRLLANAKPVPHDVGAIELTAGGGLRYFINVAGVGFDAYVVERLKALRLGPLTYLAGLLQGLLGYRAPAMDVHIGSEKISARTFVLFAAIARYCGGGMNVAPGAVTDDGLFDVTLVRNLTRLQVIRNLPKLFNGQIFDVQQVSGHWSASVNVVADPPAWIEADGELIGRTPARFSILPRALQVVRG